MSLPTERELLTLGLALRHGNKEAAARMGIGIQAVKNTLLRVSHTLGTTTRAESAIALGWLRIPEEYDPAFDVSIPPAHGGFKGWKDQRGLDG